MTIPVIPLMRHSLGQKSHQSSPPESGDSKPWLYPCDFPWYLQQLGRPCAALIEAFLIRLYKFHCAASLAGTTSGFYTPRVPRVLAGRVSMRLCDMVSKESSGEEWSSISVSGSDWTSNSRPPSAIKPAYMTSSVQFDEHLP